MDTETDDLQKRSAIDQHSRQAEQFAERYREIEAEKRLDCFTYSRQRLDAWLDRVLPESGAGQSLLDVGCGTGNHLARLHCRGFSVTGVDGSAKMLDHARRLNPGADLRQSDVENLPFPDASFDFTLCVEVLRYLPDMSRCLAEMARVLKPGGVCLATASPLLNLNGYWLINRLAHYLAIGGLVRLKQFFTTSGGLRKALRRSGFVDIEVHGVYWGPVNWAERLLPHALPRLLRTWEPLDVRLADAPVLREFSNMFLVIARHVD